MELAGCPSAGQKVGGPLHVEARHLPEDRQGRIKRPWQQAHENLLRDPQGSNDYGSSMEVLSKRNADGHDHRGHELTPQESHSVSGVVCLAAEAIAFHLYQRGLNPADGDSDYMTRGIPGNVTIDGAVAVAVRLRGPGCTHISTRQSLHAHRVVGRHRDHRAAGLDAHPFPERRQGDGHAR